MQMIILWSFDWSYYWLDASKHALGEAYLFVGCGSLARKESWLHTGRGRGHFAGDCLARMFGVVLKLKEKWPVSREDLLDTGRRWLSFP